MQSSLFDPQNPLMNPPSLPFGAPPLDLVQNEHFIPAIRWAIEKALQEIDAIKNNAVAPTFKNTVEALEFSGEDYDRIISIFDLFCAVQSDDLLRDIEDTVAPERARFRNTISLDKKLFARIKAVYDNRHQETLLTEQNRLLEESYKRFVRRGALLNEEGKTRLKTLREEMSQKAPQFRANVTKATEAYKKSIQDEAALEGLPERALKLYKRQAQEAGLKEKYLILLEPFPDDIMSHGKNRALREEIYRAKASLCYEDAYDTRTLIMDILKLQHEEAKLLGFPSYAAFVLDDRMANSIETVMDFLEGNLAVYKPAAEKDLETLRAFALKKDNLSNLKPWDIPYYSRLLKEETFHVDMESLRPYFNLEKVLEGLKQHAEKLFGIEMREMEKGCYPAYHPDVRTFEIYDKGAEEPRGIFYADYVARPGAKQGGAWMDNFREYSNRDGKISIPLIINQCNFPRASKDQPTFLTLDSVETLFHEFGHALHALLSEAPYPSLGGMHVKWDFIELPSQIQERWILEKEVLNSFAVHHSTGEPLPPALIETLKELNKFQSGLMGLRQTFLGLLDMAYYTKDPATIPDPETLENSIADRATLLNREAGLTSTTFKHIFGGGYAAGYYGYKWAEVLDADIFSSFQEKGLYDPETSARLRHLYAKGATTHPMDLFVEIMGRHPDPNALYRISGLMKQNN